MYQGFTNQGQQRVCRHTRSQDMASYCSIRREVSASLMRQSVICTCIWLECGNNTWAQAYHALQSQLLPQDQRVPCAKKKLLGVAMSLLENSSSMHVLESCSQQLVWPAGLSQLL